MYWNHWHMGGWISLAWILAILGVVIVLSLAAMARRRDRSSGESPSER